MPPKSRTLWGASCFIHIFISAFPDGWAILSGGTYSQTFDIGHDNPELLRIYASGGRPDIYLFAADTFPDLVEAVTDITGKPVMLPAFGYGLTIVNNEQELSYSIVY